MRRAALLKKYILFALLCVALFIPAFSQAALADNIAVFGDSQKDDATQRKVVQAILSFNPSIVFRVGDLVKKGNDPEEWEVFKEINRPLLTTTEYYPAPGNHEHDSPLYFAVFPYLDNRRWYSVERRGIHFIVLDSNSDLKPGSDQYKWLVRDLSGIRKSIRFRIAIFHHPILSVGSGHKEDEKKLRRILLPLFIKYNVSVVFSGHEHSYQRFEYNGICLIITAGGGAPLRGQARTSPYLKKFARAYHFCLLSVEKDFLRIKAIDADLKIMDDFRIPALSFP